MNEEQEKTDNDNRAGDRAYRPQPFVNETKRMEFLFDLYDKYTISLVAQKNMKKTKKKKQLMEL